MQFILKTLLSALIISAVSILSKKYPTFAAIIISLPITSILAIFWLFNDTHDSTKVIEFSYSIIWIVIPSVVFFILLALLLKKQVNFYISMVLSSLIMIIGYYAYVKLLRLFDINI